MGWLDKSPEKKAEECDGCAEVMEEARRHGHVPNACPRCGHLFLALCGCGGEKR